MHPPQQCGIGFLATLLTLMAADRTSPRSKGPAELLAAIDHLIYVTPDVDATVEQLDRLLGVRATPGGRHPGRGTRNALIALAPAAYLEILGPDPEQPDPERPRWFGIDNLEAPRLAGWAAKGTGLEQLVVEARRKGVGLGDTLSGSRRRSDGVLLSWHSTDPLTVVADGVVPFFIDWGATPHPAQTAAKGVSLIGLRAEHPDARRVREMLAELGVALPVDAGATPALIATLRTPRGRIELR
jgi:hypothetical protein